MGFTKAYLKEPDPSCSKGRQRYPVDKCCQNKLVFQWIAMHSPIHPLDNWALFLKSPGAFRAYFWCHDFLYLRNAEVLSHQGSQSPRFPYNKNVLKDQLFKTCGLHFDIWLFQGPKRSRDFRETVPRAQAVNQYRFANYP